MGERGYKESHVVDVARLEQITGGALMSWAELARASGVALSTLVDVRKGKPCRPGTVRKLAAALHVEPLELIKK